MFGSPIYVRPMLDWFVQQSLMIGFVVIENETAAPVGWMPGHDAHSVTSSGLCNQSLWNIYPVIEHDDIEFVVDEQMAAGIVSQKRRFKISTRNDFRIRFTA